MKTIFKVPQNLRWFMNCFMLLLLNGFISVNPFFATPTYAQGGPLHLFTKQFGGYDTDGIINIVETADGGYLLGCYSVSGPGKNKTAPNKGKIDYWIVKVDKNGNKMWDKSYGGSDHDDLSKIIKTKDGNYLLAGTSYSGKSGDKSEASKGLTDFWIVKISPTGVKLWDKTIGGNLQETLTSVIENPDGTLILAGTSGSEMTGDRTDYLRASLDVWLVKIKSDGSKLWDKAYGGQPTELSGNNVLRSINVAGDGGFLLGATSDCNRGFEKSEDAFAKDSLSPLRIDCWLLKVDANGNKIWDKTYGGHTIDIVTFVEPWHDGTILVGCWSDSPASGNKTVAPKPEWDGDIASHWWLITTDVNGNELKQSYSLSKYAYIPTEDGYFTMARGATEFTRTYLEKYNWSNQRLWRKTLHMENQIFPEAPLVTSSGHLMIASTTDVNPEITDYDVMIEKYDNKIYQPSSSNIYRAINLNSSIASLTIDNVSYVGSKVATNFTYTGRAYENQSLPLGPMPDANKAKMLRSTIYSTKTTPSTFNFLNVPNGNYEVFIYVWEDNYSTNYWIDLEGKQIVYNYESGTKGTWGKIGPFRVAVSDGQINLQAYGGDANISGIAVYKYYGTIPAAIVTSPFATSNEVIVGKTGIRAFPNSISNEVRLSFNEKTEGKASVTLLDFAGNVLQRLETEVKNGSTLVHLPADQLKPGVYLLKVKTNKGEKVIRLHNK